MISSHTLSANESAKMRLRTDVCMVIFYVKMAGVGLFYRVCPSEPVYSIGRHRPLFGEGDSRHLNGAK